MARNRATFPYVQDFSNVPLHYPRYTKAMYEEMREEELDALFRSYALPVTGDLQSKRKAAIHHFTWSSCEKLDPCSLFDKMPVHYPRYTKEDYEEMKEWQLDLLLGTYGIVSVPESLEEKRELAMGHFLWSDVKDNGDELRKNDGGLKSLIGFCRRSWTLVSVN